MLDSIIWYGFNYYIFLTFNIQLLSYVANIDTIITEQYPAKQDQILKISSDGNLIIPDKILKLKNDYTALSFVLPAGDLSSPILTQKIYGGGNKINYHAKYLKYKNKNLHLKINN